MNKNQHIPNKELVICDIDGTVADNEHRQELLKGFKDWDAFFDEMHLDKPIWPVINLVNDLHKDNKKIIFITGRPERYREKTTTWLKKYFNFEISLYMREDNDKENKLISKLKIYEENLSRYDVHLVIDNDESLLEMWANLGLTTHEVQV